MKSMRAMLLSGFALFAGGQAQAGWHNAFQVTCFHRSTPAVSSYQPVVAQYSPVVSYYQDSAPSCAPVVQQTNYVQRCCYQPVTSYQIQSYYEPVTAYRTSYYYEPVTSYRYTSYYDPCT
jgi:hypothetical protein